MASQRKLHVFRVTGLSRDRPDTDLQTALQEALQDHLNDDERSQIEAEITIVPSCYEADTQRVALVRFRGGIPQFLSELRVDPLGNWQFEMGDCDINFDCHFFGFTQLYAPDKKEPVIADIIAIAGLDGHAYGSWQGRGNLGRMWLRDFLSKDLPRCRMMIYGYNSKLSSHGVDTILDYGGELIEEIKKIRNTKELQQRPLFFIAHSFGGIILAHCLVRAIQTMEDDHPAITSLYRATYGMLLFAIPHRGLLVSDIQQMLAGDKKHPRERLLQQISSKSDLLMHQLADFKNLIQDRKVVSFYETEQTRQLVFESDHGRWERTGDLVTAVDSDSALLELPDHVEDKVPLHADHSRIVKFDTRNAAGYRTALDKLRQFAQNAPSVVAARFMQARYRLQPCSTVPFKKDPMFVGREDIIQTINKKVRVIGQGHERMALIGLAGVGKTQTAIEYAYRVRESVPYMWVFWIHASNAARVQQGYQQIAVVAEIPGRDDPKTNILQLVYQWLCDESHGHWLIVLDNADNDRMFFHSDDADGRAPLVSFLPQATHGSVLVTSRNRLAARNLVGIDGLIIDIPPMNKNESLRLLRTRIPGSPSRAGDEEALVQALEYIPLAITQAGSYIANRLPRTSVSQYLQLFHESESNQTYLLRHEDAKDLRRDPGIRDAVITTWQLSFEQIRQDQPSTTDLLALMSMFDRQGIPEDLVRGDDGRLQFEDRLAPLISYSLIRVDGDAQLFEMHRLVQLSVRAWLKTRQQLDGWQAQSRKIMAQVFPNGEYEYWTQCRSLLAHAKHVLESRPEVDDADRLNVATISDNCGWFLDLQGAYDEAEAMHRRALEAREKVLGREHPNTLTSVNNLGNVLSSQGKYDEAEAMYRRVLERSEKVLGVEHPNTLNSVDNLGLVLFKQRKYEEAESMCRRALEAQEKVLGREHLNTLTSVNNLGNVLSSQGKYDEAEAMHRRVLEKSEKVLGVEHPNTLNSVDNLGLVLFKQRKYEEAESMHRRALKGSEKALGLEHPFTLTSMKNLASTYWNQGRWNEAEKLEVQVLETRKLVLGLEHPFTLTSMNHLASTYWNQGRWNEAEKLEVQVLETRKTVLGLEHPDTLVSMANLASTYQNQGRWNEAEKLEVQVLETRKTVLGTEHPFTLISMNNLVSIYQDQGRWNEAEKLNMQVIEARRTVLGAEHPDTLVSIANLASTYRNQGRWNEAEELELQVLGFSRQILGPEHPNTVSSMGNLASTYWNQGRWKEAEELGMQVIETKKTVLGAEHPDTLISIANLASTYRNQGRWNEAEELELQVLGFSRQILGPEHPNTVSSMGNLASTYWNQGRWKEAEELDVQVMEISERILGPEHPNTLSSIANLASTYKNQGRLKEAEALNLRRGKREREATSVDFSHTLADSSPYLWSDQARSTPPSSLSYGAIVDIDPVIESRLPMTFFNYKTPKMEHKLEKREDDVQSLKSTADDINSLAETDPGAANYQQVAVKYIVKTFTDDFELLALYQEAAKTMGEATFVRNHRRLLKTFFMDLRSDGHIPSQKIAVEFLRSRNNRIRISAGVCTLVKPTDNTIREKINIMLNQEKDSLSLLDRFLDDGDSTAQPAHTDNDGIISGDMAGIPYSASGNADDARQDSEDTDDDNDRGNDVSEAELSKLKETAEFLISGRPFHLYKQNLRRFLYHSPGIADSREKLQPDATSTNSVFLEPSFQDIMISFPQKPSNNGENERFYVAAKSELLEEQRGDTNQVSHQRDNPAEEIPSDYMKPDKVTIWSSWWLWLMGICFPPPTSYRRISYICGCGELSYVDVRELSPGGIERFRQRLIKSVAAVRSRPQPSPNSNEITLPPKAQLRSSRNGPQPSLPQSLHRISSEFANTEAHRNASEPRNLHALGDPQYLLVCVNTKNSTALVHVDVSSIGSDEFLFQNISSGYKSVRRAHEWRFALLVPPLFQLIPIGEESCPRWFKTREFPPEDEVTARRYLYEPVPMEDAELADIPLPHLLKPGPHTDGFWMTMFPKKLREELVRPPGAQGQRVIGWGIRINESLDWSAILFSIFILLLVIGFVVIIYAAVTSDNNSAFSLGSFLGTLLTVYITYQYLAWKERP
ncbi:uncharacterized protein TRUGW13939_01966 [Talaromyces rugulosus]|uniref:DUF7779 domain-containing protein n=1 Tax=Talaromyces rugulosus TaxID=121627 RepID=A0A7H8QLW1_TALRU|nr:uncharacterized protein TRUGW13939_01966 [Talaromyces rugulosus]QKX54876.1 hypothetical protein TRUGW13939_01966 [Talaromyces rugulosus]